MSDTSTDDTERIIELVLCGGCDRRTQKKIVDATGDFDDGPDEPHCPRCGTRLSYEDTVVEEYEKRSVEAETDRGEQ